ncbi:hypothetical protein NLU13_3258 [Sarocladium strictum]|uniref:Uncharacterized protein n=1 Tax=Sarocladium strictum TaxID=5046 RepID=A0AA39GLN9_SARSR|nr:hypothetical protein NLU13_3258 [Sarocladium strictum]
MDSMRGGEATAGGSSRVANAEAPEQLLDVFKAAALSVTKLYKTSALNEAKARADGYQECLEDLLDFLDKEDGSLAEAARSRLRKWATDRHDGRDRTQVMESDDEVEKTEMAATPEPQQAQDPAPATESDSAPAESDREPYHFVVPSQDNFSLASQYPNIATLDLSDARQPPSSQTPRTSRTKGRSNLPGKRTSSTLGRGAGSKRRHDYDDFWGGAFGGKDTSGGPKRGRHS